jgi:tryptophan halogenase
MTVLSILIVGGGAAGWLTANHLAKRFSTSGAIKANITLIDSNEIPPIGVGEGTVPAIRQSLKYLGISETDLIRHCDATFKQSVKFVGWNAPSAESYYHHIFDYPDIKSTDDIHSWLAGDDQAISFADWVSVQGRLCDAGLGPKLITQSEYTGLANYAYHFDAAKFSKLLMDNAIEKYGVKHIKADVSAVKLKESGDIDALVTKQHGEMVADLYIDCSGFSSLLLGQSMGIPFIDKSHVLFVDTALAYQTPYDNENTPIPCSTLAVAKKAGWIWDIGLYERRGVGYVYSSSHMKDGEAEADFSRYLGLTSGDAAFRKIPMRVGYREKFWNKNCVAIGLSQGFVEPLEATGLLMFDATAKMLAEMIPSSKEAYPIAAKQFNSILRLAWDNVVDFIKMHYCISDRTDSDFWNDNRAINSIPDSLQERLEAWRWRVPNSYDFPNKLGIFHWENYLYVLYGMRYSADERNSLKNRSIVSNTHQRSKSRFNELSNKLQSHRDLIGQIKLYGLKLI